MCKNIPLSSSQFDYMQSAFKQKLKNALTRQEFFGGLSTEEEADLCVLTKAPKAQCFFLREKELSVQLYLLTEEPDSLLSVTRIEPETLDVEKTHYVSGYISVKSMAICPLTGRQKFSTWNYYITCEFWKELRALVA